MFQASTSNSNSSDIDSGIDSDIGSNSGSDSEQAQPLSFLSNMEVDTDAFGDLNTDAFGDLNTDAFGDLAGVYIEVDLAIFHMFASTTPASTHLHTLGSSKQTHLDLSGW
jgi:hypothetical protein